MTGPARKSAKQNEGARRRGKASRRQPQRPSAPTTEAGTTLVVKRDEQPSRPESRETGAAPAEKPVATSQVDGNGGDTEEEGSVDPRATPTDGQAVLPTATSAGSTNGPVEPPVVVMIDIDKIIVPVNRRSHRGVETLTESVGQIGLLHPVMVFRGSVEGTFKLGAGGGRLEAAKKREWKTIPCIILKHNELHTELAANDENLVREELPALERGEQLQRRKQIYEAIHPKAARPRGGRRPKNSETISSFARDTAKKTGKSERKVQQDIQIARKITPEVKELIRGEPIEDEKVELL